MTGQLPDYIPPHLQGSVGNFRQEADGNVSFDHFDAALGLGPEASRKSIPIDQYKKTFDRAHRLANFQDSMTGQYALRRPKSRGDAINDWVADALRSGLRWGTSDQGKTVATAGLISALAGAGVGAWMGQRFGRGKLSTGALMALLAGTAGAGLTAYGQHNFRARERALQAKTASYNDNSTEVIISAITSDRNLNSADQAQLLRVVASISSPQRDALANTLRSAIGAGAGMLVVQFLKSRGLLPLMAGGIIGALLGRATGNMPRYNSIGQLSLTNYL